MSSRHTGRALPPPTAHERGITMGRPRGRPSGRCTNGGAALASAWGRAGRVVPGWGSKKGRTGLIRPGRSGVGVRLAADLRGRAVRVDPGLQRVAIPCAPVVRCLEVPLADR